ncbi:MAG TPA: response regulator transcription factor [Acidimicrobiales bacterium]|nr:response regulator transcription factor [Acidimicrobiales bacterium]
MVEREGATEAAGERDIVVLVADGQRLFAESLGSALAHHGGFYVIGEHPTNGGGAVEAVMRHRPDVVLLDYWIPGMDGPAAAHAIASWSPGPKVLILSWFHGQIQVQKALAVGVAGFLPKSLSLAQVAAAIGRAHAGEPLVFAEQLSNLVADIDQRYDDALRRGELLRLLTSREVEILQVLATGRPGREVAAELSIALGTLKNHVHKILAKTGARTQLEVINMARHEGLIRDVGPPITPSAPRRAMPQFAVVPAGNGKQQLPGSPSNR